VSFSIPDDYLLDIYKYLRMKLALATSWTSSDTDPGSSHEGVLTCLLNEMDGVQELTGVTVLAATNRPDVIVNGFFYLRRLSPFNLFFRLGFRPGQLDRILFDQELENASTGRDSGEPGDEILKNFLGMRIRRTCIGMAPSLSDFFS
jgi:hypothetical protein